MRVLFIDTKPFNPNRYIARAVFEALAADPRVAEAVWAEYADAVPLAQATPFDLLFAFDGEEARNPVIDRLLQLVPRSLVWFTEDPYERGVNLPLARKFDLIFTNDGSSAEFYDGRGIHLPLAADPVRHRFEICGTPPRYDIFFAGTAWPNRLKFLRALKQHRPDLRCKFVLVTNDALDPHLGDLRDGFSFTPGVSIRDFCRLANAAKLTLTLPRKFSTSDADPEAASDTPGPRFFEVALAGSCQIVDAETTKAASGLFEEGAHYLGFRTMEECLAQIDAALADDDRRLAIARAAQAHVAENHLYANRVATILDRAADLPAKPLPVSEGKPRVLFVTHNVVQHGRFGGAETYLEAIRQHIGAVEPWILVPDTRKPDGRGFLLYDGDMRLRQTIRLARPSHPDLLTHPELEIAFQKLLAEYGFAAVHFNHLLGFVPSLPLVAKAMGASTLYSLHDYYPLCERFNLLDSGGRYCDIENLPEGVRDISLALTQRVDPDSQARRRRFWRESLSAIDIMLAGSEASARLLHLLYPETEARTRLLLPPVNRVEPAARNEGGPLKVAHLGNFARHKGGDAILDAIARCLGQPVQFHIFGRIDPDYQKPLETHAGKNVVLHGPFNGGAVPAALAECDVMLFLSTWPETYGITLSEAQAAGLVPIVTAIGAPAERVRDGENGFLVPVGDGKAVADILLSLMADRGRLDGMCAQLPATPGIDGYGFVSGLEDIYAGLALVPGATLDTRRLLSLQEFGQFLDSPFWTRRGGLSFLTSGQGIGFLVRRFIVVARTDGVGLALRLARHKLRAILHRMRMA
ncbi:glycosyltransferase family protein [Oceanibaculum indicum]|uniref:Group 1 glycosyl transferase n=1 Tax=Oceanibaculum indicum P24 TaxID=1207063 RepID=K2K965_9PROT|nr:glycosyltransferase [Oceanibaculum indicum]EKE73850.1 group 1 glycosyl transferase [Oceanibaculum indicum P24]